MLRGSVMPLLSAAPLALRGSGQQRQVRASCSPLRFLFLLFSFSFPF